MQFLTLTEAASQPFKTQYRYSRISALVAFVVVDLVFTVTAILAVVQWMNGSWGGTLLFGWIAFWTGLFGLVLLKVMKDRFGPANWLVRVQTHGLLLKYRSYLNPRLSAQDPVAVWIPFFEVAWIRGNHLQETLPGHDKGEEELRRLTFAEIKLRSNVDPAPLQTRLSEERKIWGPPEKTWYGSRKGVTRHYPVSLSPEGLLRISWQVHPGLNDFLSEVKFSAVVTEDVKTETSYRDVLEAASKEQEDLILDLLARGDRLGAARVAQRLYGYDTTRAMAFLKELER